MQSKELYLFRFAKYVLYFMIAAIPLTITTITYNQSDLPKSSVMFLTGSVFVILMLTGAAYELFEAGKKNRVIQISSAKIIDIPVVLFFLSAIISTVFSINMYNSFYGEYNRQIGLITYILLFLIYISVTYFIEKENFTRTIVLLMELTAAITAVYAIIQQTGYDPFGLQPPGNNRPVSTIGNAVFAGGYLALILPISVFNVSGKKNTLLKVIIPLVIAGGIIVTRTRSAYLAVIAELIIALLLLPRILKSTDSKKVNSQRTYFILAAISIAVVFVLLLMFPGNIFSERLMSIFTGGENQRWTIWRDSFGIFYKYPLTGPGIGNFANAFAEFYSYQLRYQDVMRYVDNAHNNYLQILFTMGTFGLISYLLVIGASIKVSLKNIFEKSNSGSKGNLPDRKLLFTAILVSIAGYCVYGLTNFDEFTIMFSFTLIVLILRANIPGKKITEIKIRPSFRFIYISIAVITAGFLIFGSVISVNKFTADKYFLKGEKLIKANRFKEGVSEINNAIYKCPENPVYRYTLALDIYTVLNSKGNISESSKKDLLKQASEELIKALKNHTNTNGCNALLSLIYFDLGKKNEAEELKEKVLKEDAVNVTYRLNLAYYYITQKDFNNAKEQLTEVEKTGYQAVNFWYIEAIYNSGINNKDKTIEFCNKILQNDPYNKEITEIKKRAELLQ